MERRTSVTRPIRMMYIRQIQGLVAAGLLTAAVAACGTTVAGAGTSTGGTGSTGSTGNTGSTVSSTAVGCASASVATKVTFLRTMHLVEPTRLGALNQTQTDPGLVRALFSDFCKAVANPSGSSGVMECPMDIGLSYSGTFYVGDRVVAKYTYNVSGCQQVTLIASGKTQSVIVAGVTAKAVPNLEPDMAKALGKSIPQTFNPLGTTKNHKGMSGTPVH
jgi:hypothetical protein